MNELAKWAWISFLSGEKILSLLNFFLDFDF